MLLKYTWTKLLNKTLELLQFTTALPRPSTLIWINIIVLISSSAFFKLLHLQSLLLVEQFHFTKKSSGKETFVIVWCIILLNTWPEHV